MLDQALKALGEEIETVLTVEGPLAERAREALVSAGLSDAADFATIDGVLALVDAALPGWAISLEGRASAEHGHWTCTLRRSRERDNDEVIGIARGDHPAPVLLAALLKALALGPRA